MLFCLFECNFLTFITHGFNPTNVSRQYGKRLSVLFTLENVLNGESLVSFNLARQFDIFIFTAYLVIIRWTSRGITDQ